MRIQSADVTKAVVEFTREELSLLNSALDEICNGVGAEREFQARMGCSLEEARRLLGAIHDLCSGT